MTEQTNDRRNHENLAAEQAAGDAQPRPLWRRVVRALLLALLVFVLLLGALIAYWSLRPNTANLDASLGIETWPAVRDGEHNSNTDLIWWDGHFYLIHAASPWHFGSEKCRLVLHRSKDAREWETIRTFQVPDQDIRDPKLAVIGGRLVLYVLVNVDWNPEPYKTALCTSEDGESWSELRDVEPKGWLFWRPKSRDGKTWYVPAYWWEHGKSILLKSTDGVSWERVSLIYEGDRNDETAIEFTSDGRMICTARLEVSDNIFGDADASTLIAVAEPPYTEWSRTKSQVTRLDGPTLFSHDGVVYAAGRHHPESPAFLRDFGSILGKKRTSLYVVQPDELIYLADLPSCGDTSYTGVAIRDGSTYISYYTNDVHRDYPWILGMISASEIRIAKVPLSKLAERAKPER